MISWAAPMYCKKPMARNFVVGLACQVRCRHEVLRFWSGSGWGEFGFRLNRTVAKSTVQHLQIYDGEQLGKTLHEVRKANELEDPQFPFSLGCKGQMLTGQIKKGSRRRFGEKEFREDILYFPPYFTFNFLCALGVVTLTALKCIIHIKRQRVHI